VGLFFQITRAKGLEAWLYRLRPWFTGMAKKRGFWEVKRFKEVHIFTHMKRA
jgi:hypothetical protein